MEIVFHDNLVATVVWLGLRSMTPIIGSALRGGKQDDGEDGSKTREFKALLVLL